MSTVLRVLREIALTLAALAGLICLLAVVAGLIAGIKPLIFASNSMSPHIPTGSLALARSTPAHELRVGQVVSVISPSGPRITHRIVSIEKEGDGAQLTLKGDANKTPDQSPYLVRKADVVIWSQPGLGNVARWLATPPVVFVAGLIVGAWVMWWVPNRTKRTYSGL